MHTGKLSRWLWLGLVLNISIMVWRFWVIAYQAIALLPYRTVTDWISEPPVLLIFYGAGFFGIQMAVTGDRCPLLFWDVVYLALIVPLRPVWLFGAAAATIATYIGHLGMRREHRTREATLSN
jgi:hypothetical protein